MARGMEKFLENLTNRFQDSIDRHSVVNFLTTKYC